MTIIELINLLAARCESLVVNYLLETGEVNKKPNKPPQVVKYFLPTKDPKPGSTNQPDNPAIIIRPVEGDDTDDGSTAKVHILIATHSLDNDGVGDAINLMQHIRDNLLNERFLVDEFGVKKSRVELPMKWRVYEEQPRPQWFVSLEVNFNIAQAAEVLYHDR